MHSAEETGTNLQVLVLLAVIVRDEIINFVTLDV